MFDYLLAKPKVHNTVLSMLESFANRRMASGERLPPVRKLAEEFNVSIYTIHTAINELKKSGILQEKEKNVTCLVRLPDPDKFRKTEHPVTISLLVRDFRDMRKLNSMLIREQAHVAFKEKYHEIAIVQRQTSALKIDFDTEQINLMINGEGPTVSQMSWTVMPVYRDLQLISELDRKLAEPHLSQLKPFCVERCMTRNCMFMLPSGWTATCLIYNRELFAAAGLDPEESFSTLEKFIMALRCLKKKSGSTPLLFQTGVELYFWLQHLVAAFADPLKPGGQMQTVDWNSDAALSALACFHQLYFVEKLVGCVEASDDEICLSILADQKPLIFDSGKWAGMLMGTRHTAKFGMERLPGRGSERISLCNITGWIINAKASPEEQLGGLRYALFREEWLHRGSGGKARVYFKDFPKPWQFYKNPATDRFLTENSEFPPEWQRQAALIEKEMIWEPFCNDWAKYTHGDQLLTIGRSTMAVTPEILRLCLSSLSDQRNLENDTEKVLCS